jgi:hypothetical protein
LELWVKLLHSQVHKLKNHQLAVLTMTVTMMAQAHSSTLMILLWTKTSTKLLAK